MKNTLLLFILFTSLVSWGQHYDVYLNSFHSEDQSKTFQKFTYKIPENVNIVQLNFNPRVVPDAFYFKYGNQEFWSGFVGEVYVIEGGLYNMISVPEGEKERYFRDIYPSRTYEDQPNENSNIVNRFPRNFAGELVWYKQKDGLLEAINSEIGKVGGSPVQSIFKNGDENAEKITNGIKNTNEKLLDVYNSYGDILKGVTSFAFKKESGEDEITIMVFSPLHGRLFDILINTCNSCQEPLNNISVLEEKSNQYYLNGSLYDGSVYDLYDSGQLKEEFQVKGGKNEGSKIIYHQDNSYRKENYKDATLITQIESNLRILNDELSSLEKDSSGYYNRKRSLKSEMGDKFDKYKEKYNEGKLKGNKLELYQDYLTYSKKLEDKTSELSKKRNEKKNGEQELKSEKNKSEYVNKIKESFTYVNGQKTGVHKEYDKYENLVLEEELKNGVRNGSYKRYKGDVIVEEGTYSNGLMNGEWVYRWDNGNLKGQGNYVDGDGRDIPETSYYPRNGLNGNWISYFNDGSKERCVHYNKGLPEGNDSLFYKSGKLKSISFLIILLEQNVSVPDGEYLSYYENGNLEEKSQWTKGKRNGLSTTYYSNGNVKSELNYTDMIANGIMKNYHENGQLESSFEYINGKGEARYYSYYENGNKKDITTYKNGEREFEGSRIDEYNSDGTLKKKWEFRNGKWEEFYGWVIDITPEEKERRRVEWENHQKELLTMKHKCRRCNSEYVGQGWDYHLGDEALSKFYYVDKNCSVTRSLLR